MTSRVQNITTTPAFQKREGRLSILRLRLNKRAGQALVSTASGAAMSPIFIMMLILERIGSLG